MEHFAQIKRWLFAQISKAGKTPSTTKTYVSLISNLYRRAADGVTRIDQFVMDVNRMLALVAQIPSASTRATTLAALYALTKKVHYHTLMKEESNKVRTEYTKQRQTPKQSNLAHPEDELDDIHSDWLQRFLKNANATTATNTLITGLMSGVYKEAPPRRLLDYAEMKIRNFDEHTDNYVTEKTDEPGTYVMVFHKFKTAAHESGGPHILTFPYELLPVLRYRMSLPGDYLLISKMQKAMSTQQLHQRLKTLYGFSVNLLRQLHVSKFHRETPALQTMEKLAKDMGHSVNSQLLFYTKKN